MPKNRHLVKRHYYYLVAVMMIVSNYSCHSTPTATNTAETVLTGQVAYSKYHSPFVPEGYSCVWHDEFDGVNCNDNGCEVNPENWQFRNLNVNHEKMLYTQRQCTDNPQDYNYCIREGVFTIKARDEGRLVNCSEVGCADDFGWQCHQGTGCADREEQYTSGRIMSKTKVEKRYGYIEIAFRLPFSNQDKVEGGLWPAFFMLNSNIAEGPSSCGKALYDRRCEVPWPTAAEIDILENLSASPDLIFNNVHWDPGAEGPAGDHASCDKRPSSLCSAGLGWRPDIGSGFNIDRREWNILGLEWREDSIHWSLNGNLNGSFDSSGEQEFDRDMYLIMNMAVGGDMGGKIDISDWSDAAMEYAYVRWYQKGAGSSCALTELPAD